MRLFVFQSVPPVLLGAVLIALYFVIPHPRALAGRYILTQSDVPGFTLFLSRDVPGYPFSFSMPTNKSEIECQESGFSFFVTNEAVSDGASLRDAHEVSQSAPFILFHHGGFEVNDRVSLFSTANVAHRYYEDLAYSDPDPTIRREILDAPTFGDESLATRQTQGGPDYPVPEPDLVVVWRRGRVLTLLNIYGSADQTPDLLLRLAALIDQRIQQQGQ